MIPPRLPHLTPPDGHQSLPSCRTLALVLAALTSLWSVTERLWADSPAGIDTAGIEYFEKQVRPILVEHCYECHAEGESSGGLRLDSRESSRRGGDSGPAVLAGDLGGSLLIEAVRYENRDLQMPPQNQLSQDQIAKLEKWILLGAPDPRDASEEPLAATGMSIEEGREFWAFQPIADPAVPTPQHDSWVQTPIDAFVLARLESQGLTPAPAADRRTLIRRITYDLIGLPPTKAEIDAFVLDESPQAVSNLVERLLSSPQYGVRWGRHWLDVVRYADSNGLDENLAYGNAWRYRDYVVQSFNQDKPFDQFLIEQIAGDLMPGATPESQTATGFLMLGAKVLAEPDFEKLVMDTVDEQIDAMGKALMGMTLGCVRCHDHKFDPVKQSDYYSLAAIFKSTKTFGDTRSGAIKHWHEIVYASDEEQETIKQLEAEIAAKKSAAAKLKSNAIADIRTEARFQAAEYLIAATFIDLDTPLTRVAEVAKPWGLHPRILHHCRRHLHFHASDPFFQPWHQAVGDQHAELVEAHYRPLFRLLAEATSKQAADKTQPLGDPRLELARQAIEDLSGFLAVPPKPEFAFDPETLEKYHDLMEQARVFESKADDLTAAMGVADGEILDSIPIHIRGSHLSLGRQVPREFPEVMRVSAVRPLFPSNQSGRLELARWLASTQHPLTSRVYVNRIWRWHFGRGIVGTTENFGLLGDRPSHPQLLDWLARYFMRNGWSTKQLHRLIIASSVYQMSSQHPDEASAFEVDPENLWRWKFPMERLDAEQIRDSILATADSLDQSLGGKTVPLRNRQFVFNHTSVDHTQYDSPRRALYLPVIRNNLYSLFQQFDFPDPTMPTGDRKSTVVAPQALWMMNAELVMDAADKIAADLLGESSSDASRIEWAYQRILGRSPSSSETDRGLAFIDEMSRGVMNETSKMMDENRRRAWNLFCHALYASNEFIVLR